MGYQSIVTLLNRTDPGSLRRLMSEHPGERDLFSIHRELGDDDKAKELSAHGEDASRRAALVGLAAASIKALAGRTDNLIAAMLARMRNASRIKLAGALVATLSGIVGTLWTMYMGPATGLAAATPAAVAAAGGLTSLFADHAVRSSSGLTVASPEEHGKLVAVRMEVERFSLRLGRDEVLPLKLAELESMLAKLDEFSLQSIRLASV